jgi:hypothetical protein
MMTPYRAVALAEGFEEGSEEEGSEEEGSEEEIIAAWQHLIDTGLAWSLQGWFGRQARALIEQGVCHG